MRSRASDHASTNGLDQIQGARDVRVDYIAHLLEVLFEERAPESAPGVGQQGRDRAVFRGRTQGVASGLSSKVKLKRRYGSTAGTQPFSSRLDFRLIGGDEQIESVFGATLGELEADAALAIEAFCFSPLAPTLGAAHKFGLQAPCRDSLVRVFPDELFSDSDGLALLSSEPVAATRPQFDLEFDGRQFNACHASEVPSTDAIRFTYSSVTVLQALKSDPNASYP